MAKSITTMIPVAGLVWRQWRRSVFRAAAALGRVRPWLDIPMRRPALGEERYR